MLTIEGVQMCQAIPARVVRVESDVAWIDQEGQEVPISLIGLGEVDVGDYVYHHAGLGLERLEPEMAKEILSVLEELNSILNWTDET
jgi:hydrogenase expression/formation protein HypC